MLRLKFLSPFAVALIMLTFSDAQAQSDDGGARLEAARAYLAVTNTDRAQERMAAVAANSLLDTIRSNQPELFNEKGDQLRQLVVAAFVSGLQEAMIGADRLLASQFSLEELEALAAFAQTPEGRSVLEKLPEFTASLQPRIQAALKTMLPQLISMLREEGVTVGGN